MELDEVLMTQGQRLKMTNLGVTPFKCGGFVLGQCLNHCMVDGIDAMEFVDSWGETSGRVPLTFPPILYGSMFIMSSGRKGCDLVPLSWWEREEDHKCGIVLDLPVPAIFFQEMARRTHLENSKYFTDEIQEASSLAGPSENNHDEVVRTINHMMIKGLIEMGQFINLILVKAWHYLGLKRGNIFAVMTNRVASFVVLECLKILDAGQNQCLEDSAGRNHVWQDFVSFDELWQVARDRYGHHALQKALQVAQALCSEQQDAMGVTGKRQQCLSEWLAAGDLTRDGGWWGDVCNRTAAIRAEKDGR
ncbi:hypothetical protein TIFTF001_026587 [Ficus carica]|uniref:Uncharacterized protein n=1 Tax=Ficus carica TaxID=3494 RepID=A0AA88DLG4_FICCA|nr:hypothetical protein TIFTF001_026587 [Ficus carica]